ncbi:MAG: GTP 3',8-cyclase MoaA [Candidatus Bathyarchaeota archaeon]|nr:GTP 3',8-cyclase MoaA [Candidatus Bathyarchaeota archaeon]
MITDGFGRPVLNLRISVTQRCNFHCPYCHREGQELNPRGQPVEMTSEEIIRLAKVAIGLDIRRIKLTGGEPLLRGDLLKIVNGIASLPGIEDLSMTTNGTLLASMAKDLRVKGLMRVNISLPSLNSSIYTKLMGGNLIHVLCGIEAAVEAEFNPVKLNMLVLAGHNEDEIPGMIEFARKNRALLQLIELEAVNLTEAYYNLHHYSLENVEIDFAKRALRVDARSDMQNRHVYYLPEGVVEVIRPTENTEFCSHCTRLRLTSDGKLKPCLMLNSNLIDILTPMRQGATDQQLTEIFSDTCRSRTPFYREQS